MLYLDVKHIGYTESTTVKVSPNTLSHITNMEYFSVCHLQKK